MKHLLLLLLVALMLGCSEERKDIINVPSEDTEMNAAILSAQKSINEFWAARDQMGEEFVGLLKVYFPSKEANENGEHMWIEPISRDVNSITGKLLSIPEWIDYVEAGDVVTVTVEDVTDWLYVEGGMAKGAVTVNLLRSRMTLDERRAHDEQYPFRFD